MRGRHNEDHQDEWDGDLRNPEQNSKEFQIERNIIKGVQSVQIPANMKLQIKVK